MRSADFEHGGRVWLVGAGPGDVDLLTLRAVRIIEAADVIFCDRLVGSAVLDLILPGTRVVYVGKSRGEHSVPQEEIHTQLIDAARQGQAVVRLKGGDPFIFGRGGEELEALRAAGIRVDIVPGVSAALGCAAAAQIPLTHRAVGRSVTFVTGHAALGVEPELDWSALARAHHTVVVFMGVGSGDIIARRIIAAGRDPNTPVAVIENGTRSNQIIAYGRLQGLSDLIQTNGIQGPALLIIGEVAACGLEADFDRLQTKGDGREERVSLSDLWGLFS